MATSNIIITFVLKQTIAGNEELVRSYIDTSPLLMIFSTAYGSVMAYYFSRKEKGE